jgi:cysteine desulfurase NifS/selenium donor protein
MNPVYLDNNATTPLDPRVAEAMRPFLDSIYGNPSSSHEYGIIARQSVEAARKELAKMLNSGPDEIIFTSGGTESNNMALKGFAFANAHKGRHLITSSIEHPAVLEVCRYLETQGFVVTYLPVDRQGLIDPDDFKKAIRPGTILASIMHANNEVGTIQPVGELSAIAREHGIVFHCDAAQSVGKIPVDVMKLGVDLLSVAGHKFYAPKGVGALYCRRGVKLSPLLHGADHEQGMRAGTENIISIAGLGKAAELVHNERKAKSEERRAIRMKNLRDKLYQGINSVFPEIKLNGHPEKRLPNTLSLGFKGRDASILLNEWKGIAASAGAACHAGSETISGVLLAMKVPREYALGTIRFSVGRMSTGEDIERAIDIISEWAGKKHGDHLLHAIPWIIHSAETLIPSGENEPGIQLHEPPGKAWPPALQQAADNSSGGIKLTAFTHALGCACKIKPQVLERILKAVPGPTDKAVLVGTETSDDAAVYLFSKDRALVQTVDFIPPVVDDPYDYGAIAAANALSDIYAMGGKPLFALSIVAFPEKMIPIEVLGLIIQGAADKAKEAGISIIGGHSIEDEEPKFGLVVSGEVHPERIWKNSTPQAGDMLILTKPLGTGIITTAIKRNYAGAEAAREAVAQMSLLNKDAAEILMKYSIHACTDVTGFGLLGHLKEMLSAGNLDGEISWKKVPLLAEAMNYAVAGMIPGGTKNNLEFVRDILEIHDNVPDLIKIMFSDAQTSGGLLIALAEPDALKVLPELVNKGINHASVIGRIVPGRSRIIIR